MIIFILIAVSIRNKENKKNAVSDRVRKTETEVIRIKDNSLLIISLRQPRFSVPSQPAQFTKCKLSRTVHFPP